MAKIQYSEFMPEDSGILDVFSKGPALLTEEHASTYANFNDADTSNRIIFQGQGFQYQDGTIVKGTLDDILFADQDTDVMFSVANIKANVADLSAALTQQGLSRLLKMLFNGDDNWIGSDGTDYLTGYKGNDKLTGGAGGDTFGFATHDGTDVIKDFHRDDGDNIDVHRWKGIDGFHDVKSHAEDHGSNVWITLGHDTLVISNMHKAELAMGDFDF